MNTVLLGQYEAALFMLRDAIASCPAEHWEMKVANYPARFAAFHTLYWADIYLTRTESEFESHEFVMEGRGLPFGEPFPTGGGKLPPGLSRERSLEYADFCINKARDVMQRESESDLAGESGFWQKISRAEMHIYNIRHIQHHTGALAAHIRRLVPEFPEEGMDWIDTGAKL